MAYRIFFSGLMVFVRYKAYEQVDVLLLNPCAEKGHVHLAADGSHAHTPSHGADDASCVDRHFPQLMVKRSDLAEWNLPGAMHGCGWHHFDLTGRTVYSKASGDRQITLPSPDDKELDVNPFGVMRQVSFQKGIIDMVEVLKGAGPYPGRIDHKAVTDQLENLGQDLIAARVRLPKGTLTALAPLDTSPRRAFPWKIGEQILSVLGEAVMFVPGEGAGNRIDIDEDEYITLRNKENATVWISVEPLRMARALDPELKEARHFEHYYKLLPPSPFNVTGKARPRPELHLAVANLGNPLCPPTGEDTDPPLP